MSQPKIIVAGSINMDVIARTQRHPKPGETLFGSELHFIPGGKGANQAVAAGRLSERVHLVGKLGRDAFGSDLAAFLQREGLNLEHLVFDGEAPSGTALIVVDERSENTIVVVSGSNYTLSEADVAQVDINADDVLVSVFEIPQETIRALFKRAMAVGATTLLNPAPAVPFIPELQAMVRYLVLNETELAFFAGADAVPQDATALKALAAQLRADADQTIIITMGAKGVIALHGEALIQVAGRPVQAVDTTGAGDCFVGALAVALSEGQPLREALHFANVAASLSVQHLGASAAMPRRAAVDAAASA